ncbi:MAG: hypothetical protein HC944_02850 [Nanoarchaeota archaeon]|nr:hypothetical protein [Nanoarchaeota archaeon]
MTLASTLSAVQSFIIDNFDFDEDTCRIEDEGIFDFIQTRSHVEQKAALLVFGGGISDNANVEFGAITMGWSVDCHFFFRISSTDLQHYSALARDMVDDFILSVAPDSTLGNTVLHSYISNVEPIALMERGKFSYYWVPISIVVVDNIS